MSSEGSAGPSWAMQAPYSAAYKNFRLGLRTYQSKCTKFNFLLTKFSSVILYCYI
jgi:hypothetical protein